MNRQQKESAVANFKNLFSSSQAAFLVTYKGISVANLQSLRRSLNKLNGNLKITKARLMKIAARDVQGIDEFRSSFKNQVGIVFASHNIPEIAKTLTNFAKDYETFSVVSGFFEHRSITKEQVSYLASLPSREVLLAQLLGVIQGPITSLAGTLQMIPRQLLFALKALEEKGQNEGSN